MIESSRSRSRLTRRSLTSLASRSIRAVECALGSAPIDTPSLAFPPAFGLLTVDVEDWFHPLVKDPAPWDEFEDRIELPTGRLLETLQATGSRGTFFN